MTTQPPAPNNLRTVLIVDDEPANLALLTQVLQPHYRVRAARSGEQALRAVSSPPLPDIVLLDIMMPGMDGHAVLAALKERPEDALLPVIFVTALDDAASEERGLASGAVDYLTKPITPAIVLARVRLHLELKDARDALKNQNALLEQRVAERTAELKAALSTAESAHDALKESYFNTLMAISAIIELRGQGLGDHCRRVANLARQVAQVMRLPLAQVQDVFVGALLHDIGLLGTSDDLLAKPIGLLSQEQLVQYHAHPADGASALQRIEGMTEVADMIADHHEHFDGLGFPSGKSGLMISIGARIIAAASDYDDFNHGKLTGKPLSTRQSFEHMLEGRGSHYDALVVDALEQVVKHDFSAPINEIQISLTRLQAGMVIARDLRHPDGYLLLAGNTTVTEPIVDQLLVLDRGLGGQLKVFVVRDPPEQVSGSTERPVKR